MRIGHRMAKVAAYVTAHPGRPMRAAAHWVNPSPNPSRCEGHGYNPVHRALAAGLIVGRPGPRGSTLLYPAEVVP